MPRLFVSIDASISSCSLCFMFTGELIATVAAVTCLFGALFVALEIDRDFSPDSRRTTFDFELLGSYRVAMPARRRFYASDINVLFLLSCRVEKPPVLLAVLVAPFD